MSPLTRSLSLALLLVAMFLGIVLALQGWLQHESTRLQQELAITKQAQLAQAWDLFQRPPDKWDGEYQKKLGDLLGGKVSLLTATEAKRQLPASAPEMITLEQELKSPAGTIVRLAYAPPVAQRLAALHRRVLVTTIIVALLLLMVPVLLNLVRRSDTDTHTQSPWHRASAEMTGLEQLARITVERGEKLAHESGARLRAEENLQVSSSLLTQSQAERARLGRELHDNICQTLYAVSLTLESVRRKISATPEIWQRLEQSISELRRLNQEVRTYLSELGPEKIRMQSFTDAINQMLEILPVSSDLKISRQLEEDVVALIKPQQTAEIVNILREAISNAARHGHARHITIRAEQDENVIALAVQDDGTGFIETAQQISPGHGLGNMQARATALGGTLKVESSTGKGTRVVLLLPVASAL